VEVGLGLVAPVSGARADVVVRAPAGTRLRDVQHLLLQRLLAAGATGALSSGGQPLPPAGLHVVLTADRSGLVGRVGALL
jgi:hypothetical protein